MARLSTINTLESGGGAERARKTAGEVEGRPGVEGARGRDEV